MTSSVLRCSYISHIQTFTEQKAGNSPVTSPNLLPAHLYYLSNFSAATSKNFTLDQAVPPCANGSIVLTKT